MSESTDADAEGDTLQQVADAFGRTLDPLAEFEDRFNQLDPDPFAPYDKDILQSQDLDNSTLRNYRSAFEEWQAFMNDLGRNPACPTDTHVVRFIEWQLDPE